MAVPPWEPAKITGGLLRRYTNSGTALADRYRLKRLWARDRWHLCHRVIRKILCPTVAIWLNVFAGLEPLRFADLLAA